MLLKDTLKSMHSVGVRRGGEGKRMIFEHITKMESLPIFMKVFFCLTNFYVFFFSVQLKINKTWKEREKKAKYKINSTLNMRVERKDLIEKLINMKGVLFESVVFFFSDRFVGKVERGFSEFTATTRQYSFDKWSNLGFFFCLLGDLMLHSWLRSITRHKSRVRAKKL